MDYYLGGYFLVEGCTRPTYTADFLPTTIWSISSCLCASYPDIWALSWVSSPSYDLSAIQKRLGLSDADFQRMQEEVDRAFDEQLFGWPNIWLDMASAQRYYSRYLSAIPLIKLLAIALPEQYLNAYLIGSDPPAKEGKTSLYHMLAQGQKMTDNHRSIGFEILGEDVGCFHSFLCNSLETAYQRHLHITFNRSGLLHSYDDAQRAADYTNLDTTGAEPVTWYPWMIVEYPLLSP